MALSFFYQDEVYDWVPSTDAIDLPWKSGTNQDSENLSGSVSIREVAISRVAQECFVWTMDRT